MKDDKKIIVPNPLFAYLKISVTDMQNRKFNLGNSGEYKWSKRKWYSFWRNFQEWRRKRAMNKLYIREEIKNE